MGPFERSNPRAHPGKPVRSKCRISLTLDVNLIPMYVSRDFRSSSVADSTTTAARPTTENKS